MTSMRQKYDIIQASTNTTSAADSYAEMLAYPRGRPHAIGEPTSEPLFDNSGE